MKKLTNETIRILEALGLMYEQYCKDGHLFMTAGENASAILEEYGMLNPDPGGRGEIKYLTNKKDEDNQRLL